MSASSVPPAVAHATAQSQAIPDNTSLRQICLSIRKQIDTFLAEDTEDTLLKDVQSRTRESLAVMQEALTRYDLSSLSLSYNGGKDCLVLLILYLASLASYPSPLPTALQSIYIVSPSPFPEVESFTTSSAEKYHLSLLRLERENMREAFAEYLSPRKEGRSVKAILVGTRRTDPHGGKLGSFETTDGLWPRFMRINAVIDWKYREIWKFIKHLDIPYCELYDRGYTSLGGTEDTNPNPALLLREDQKGGKLAVNGKRYRPAHELWADEEERLGRE